MFFKASEFKILKKFHISSMKENLNQEILDLRVFENPINPIDLIKSITSDLVTIS